MSNATMWLSMQIRDHPPVCSSMTVLRSASQMALLFAPVWHSGSLLASCEVYSFAKLDSWVGIFFGRFHLCRCGYDQQVSSGEMSPTDGMLGLGTGSVSLLSQFKQHGVTKNVVGHCLSLRGGGFLFFGDDLVPYQRVTWTPMARSALRWASWSFLKLQRNLFPLAFLDEIRINCGLTFSL